MPINFGTDGWRALIAEEFTSDNVSICAQATSDLMKESGLAERGLVVGYDTRLDSDIHAATVAEVVAASGIPVTLSDRPVPTPMVSHSVVDRRAGGGVVITASHNPAQYNGYKYKLSNGSSATEEIVAKLEQHVRRLELTGLPDQPTYKAASTIARVNLISPYMKHIGRLVNLQSLRSAGLKVVTDPMYGSGLGLLPQILRGGSTSVVEIHGEPNPKFPGIDQPEPTAANLVELGRKVVDSGADIGIANDGDADRLGLVDETGRFVTALETFSLLCLYELEVLGNRGPLIRSLTQSVMVDKLANIYGVTVTETKVGFKHIAPLFEAENALAAGEESGGYTVRGNVPERDGILCGLLMLDMMVKTNKRLSELVDWLIDLVGPHLYDRSDITFDADKRNSIVSRIRSATPSNMAGLSVDGTRTDDGFKFNLAGGYWVLIRFSGTEPLLRIYAEADCHERLAQLLREARAIAIP